MIVGSWRLACFRGISLDHRVTTSKALIHSFREQYSRYSHNQKQLQSSFSKQTDLKQSRTRWAQRHTIYATRESNSPTFQPDSKSERSIQCAIQDESNLHKGEHSLLPHGKKLSIAQRSGWNRRTKGNLRQWHKLSYIPAIKSQGKSTDRHRSSLVETRRSRQRKHRLTRSSIIWRIRLVARKKSLQDDFRRRYSPRIWGIIARALPYWFAESSHIYSAIVENDSPSPTVTPKALLQFHRFIRSNSTVESQRGQIYQAWAAKSWRGKTVWWRHALYYALLHSPTDASRIAIDISKRPYLQIPGKFIADVLLLIQCRYVDSEVDIKSEDERIIAFYETACQYLEYYVKREGSAILPQSIIRSLSQALDSDRLNRLVKLIDLSKTEYNLYTKLHAMHRYLELNNLTDALELYSTLTEKEFSNRAAKSFCTTVLRLPWQVEDLHTLQQQLTIFMLEKGFHFNTIMRNVILQNHLESGHRQIAWQLLEGFRKAGLNTSEHTYSLFLRHTSPDDYHTISSLYHMAVEDDWLSRSVYLAGYFIQVAASSRLTAGQNSFDAVLKLFRTMFNTTDLEDLGILERSMHTSNLQSPSSFAVQWMLMSWLQENRRDPEKLASVYNNYQFHLKNSHPRISLLASSTHLGTFFVLAFGCNKSHLHMCTRVLQDMIHPTAPASSITHETAPDIPDYEKFLEPEDPIERVTTPTEEQIMIVEQETSLDIPDFEKFLEPEDPIEQEIKHSPEYRQNPDVRSSSPSYIVAPPGEYTWNALLAVLLRHKRLDAAESALTAMRDAGFPPNQYTWNILIEGFATSKIPIEINPAGESQRFKPTANEQNINQLTIFKKESVMLRRFKANLENVKLARDKVYETGHSISQS